jgi:hypothetical protein
VIFARSGCCKLVGATNHMGWPCPHLAVGWHVQVPRCAH